MLQRPQLTNQIGRIPRVKEYCTDANLEDSNAIVNENY